MLSTNPTMLYQTKTKNKRETHNVTENIKRNVYERSTEETILKTKEKEESNVDFVVDVSKNTKTMFLVKFSWETI